MNLAKPLISALPAALAAVLPAQEPRFDSHRSGCPGPGGTPGLWANFGSSPQIGELFSVLLTYPLETSGVLFLGYDDTALGGATPLPLDLGFLGLIGCELHTDVVRADPLVLNGGTGLWERTIPLDPSLLGLQFFMQGAVVDPAIPGLPIVLSGSRAGVVGDYADLVITTGSLTVSPTVIEPGSVAEVASWTVQNIGLVPTGPFTNKFYLSGNSFVTTGDILLATVAHPGLAPGESFVVPAQSVPISGSLSHGNYWIGVITDADGAVNERDEANNLRATQIEVGIPPLPDLVVTGSSGPSITPGSLLLTPLGDPVLDVTRPGVRNQGAAVSTACSVCLIAWDPSGLNPTELHRIRVPPLQPGWSWAPRYNLENIPFPNTLPSGTYQIGYRIDSDSEVDEENEWNNVGARTALPVNNPFVPD